MNKPLTVDQYLALVKYGDLADYIPSKHTLDFVNFIKLVNGADGEENITPVLHLMMLDKLFKNSGSLASLINMVFRGAAKTTLLGEYLFLYLAFKGGLLPGFGVVEFALYVSDSVDNGVKSMRDNLETRWTNSEFLQQWVPKVKFTDVKWQFWNADGKVFTVKGYGAKTGVRGTKSKNKRPKLAVLDDLVSDEDARSPTVIAAIEATVHKAITFALHPTQHKIVWSGTPFNSGDPLYKAIESGAWDVNAYPVCERFPCTREEFVGAWPDRFSFDYVETMYNKLLMQGKVGDFNQEMMLQIMSDEDRLVLDSDIRWYNSAQLIRNMGNYNFYITTDFATSEKQSADFSFISVWAYNNNEDWFWVDGVCRRQLMDANMNDLFRFVSKYKPLSVGIEVSGQQGGFIPWIQQEMMTRNIWFTLARNENSDTPGLRPSVNKLQRFNVMVPVFKQGKIYLPDDKKLTPAMSELLEELKLASASGFKSKHDDGLDTISMLSLMKPFAPSHVVETVQDGSGIYGMPEQFDTDTCSINSYIV